MVPSDRLAAALDDPRWRYPLACGAPAAALSLLLYALTAGPMDLTPLPFAAVAAGYLYEPHADSEAETRRVGKRTGLVAAAPAAVTVLETAAAIPGLPAPAWFQALGVVTVVVAIGLFVGVAFVLGIVGALVGRWLAGKTGRRRAPVTGA